MFSKVVTTKEGVRKVITAQFAADLSSAVSVAQNEVKPKIVDINDKSYANKRYQDLS